MKKNFRVIQINGFRGLFLAIFAISCLIAGFIAFPSLVAMHTWNYLATTTGSLPLINLGEAILLWAIILFSIFIFNKKKFIVSFNGQQELSDEEVKEVIAKIKAQKNNLQSLHSKDLNIQNIAKTEDSAEKTELPEIPVLQGENKEN
jgi:hypothetical protein